MKKTWAKYYESYQPNKLNILLHFHYLISIIILNPKSILEIGCGSAEHSMFIKKAFNRKNTSRPISYDHLLNSRRFNSVIYKEDNDLGDRQINDYINDNALMQLMESDRIKEVIRNIEIDMWNY